MVFLLSCAKVLPAQTQLHLGTVCSINLYEDGTQQLYRQMFEELSRIENIFSVNLPDSDISRINNAAGIESVKVSPELVLVLEQACKIAQESGGAFDPTIGPLVELWNIGGENPRVPSHKEIEELLPLVNFNLVKIDATKKTVFLSQKGMSLDLGGIAKGFAADCLVKIAKEHGVKSALFDLGGNVYAYGTKADGTLWRVGIKNPLDPAKNPVLRLDVKDKTVVTSGMYERFFEQDGNRYHHILNAKTGFPARNNLLSVTIVAENSMIADALSTAAFILGTEQGLEIIAYNNAQGVFILDDKSILATPILEKDILILSEEFTKHSAKNDN